MTTTEYHFSYDVYSSPVELDKADAELLLAAQQAAGNAWAPYSRFHVGAAARLANGKLITGANQENASYPAGICAERVLLSAAAALYPGVPVTTLAVTYSSEEVKSDHPISPCGICRQSLIEFEQRVKQPIRLVLGGLEGKVFVIPQASVLLPFSFTGDDLK